MKVPHAHIELDLAPPEPLERDGSCALVSSTGFLKLGEEKHVCLLPLWAAESTET